MANCYKCWWADYNKDAPGRHVLHEEPDYFKMKSAFGEPPMTRVVKSCGKGKSYFQTFVKQDHDCSAFEDFAKKDIEQQKKDERVAKTWEGKTSRMKLPPTTNLLVLIEKMFEGNNDAYDRLMWAMELGDVRVSALIRDLDDMNIRGEQIVHAFEYAEGNPLTLAKLASERSSALVRYVNRKSELKDERAIERGSSLYGHVKYVPAVAQPRKARIGIIGEETGKRVVFRVRKIPIKRKAK